MNNDLNAVGASHAQKLEAFDTEALLVAFAEENARLHGHLSLERAQRSNAEAQLRAAMMELASANRLRAMGELVASIVHEVAQPITALDTSARAGLRWLDRSVPDIDNARETLRHITACAARASTIVSGLRASARQVEPQMTRFSVADALHEAVAMIGATLQSMQVTLRIADDSRDSQLYADRTQLQQVMINLMTNGAEAMVGVPAQRRQLDVGWEAARGLLRIHVDDRGDGIDPQLADRLFEPLFSTKPHGMGMGLFVCKTIVAAHEGRIELLPHEGGTRATVTLPYQEASTPACLRAELDADIDAEIDAYSGTTPAS